MANSLAIDFGLKRIGLAYSINNIIFTLPQILNSSDVFKQLQKIITNYDIHRVFVGLSEGRIATLTNDFISKLRGNLNIPVDTVEEAVSTIEAEKLYKKLGRKKADYKKNIDSFSAAVILGRALGYN
jgi:putative transcription antitermination factor YqgF